MSRKGSRDQLERELQNMMKICCFLELGTFSGYAQSLFLHSEIIPGGVWEAIHGAMNQNQVGSMQSK